MASGCQGKIYLPDFQLLRLNAFYAVFNKQFWRRKNWLNYDLLNFTEGALYKLNKFMAAYSCPSECMGRATKNMLFLIFCGFQLRRGDGRRRHTTVYLIVPPTGRRRDFTLPASLSSSPSSSLVYGQRVSVSGLLPRDPTFNVRPTATCYFPVTLCGRRRRVRWPTAGVSTYCVPADKKCRKRFRLRCGETLTQTQGPHSSLFLRHSNKVK